MHSRRARDRPLRLTLCGPWNPTDIGVRATRGCRGEMEGEVQATRGAGVVSRVPLWAVVMAWTMDRPRPAPPSVRGDSPRTKGSRSRVASSGAIGGPVLVMRRNDRAASVPVVTAMWPPAWLYRMALSSRLPTMRSSRIGSPLIGPGRRTVRSARSRAVIPAAAPSSRPAATSARSTGRCLPGPAWLRASARSPSRVRRLCSTAVLMSSAMASSSARSGSPSRVTSMAVRMVVNGVRSSWAALAVNIRWLPSTRSRSRMPVWMRSSIPLMVPARSASSSAGVVTGTRSERFSAERRCAVAEIARIGRSTRPATSHPSTAATRVTTASASAAWVRSSDRVAARTRSARSDISCRSARMSSGAGDGPTLVRISHRRSTLCRTSRYVSAVSMVPAARTSTV